MFKKVLLVEDQEAIGSGISIMLKKDLGIAEVKLMQYCNEAYLYFQNQELKKEPFELLITDLSFKKDHRGSKINSGLELIEKIRSQNKTVPIIICSVEEKPKTAANFINKNKISGYVLKGRDGLKDLKKAINAVFNGKQFISESLRRQGGGETSFEIEDYELSLLFHLSKGLSQGEISSLFTSKGISPSSLSSIEKRLNRLKDILRAGNNVQLVANAKDLGLI